MKIPGTAGKIVVFTAFLIMASSWVRADAGTIDIADEIYDDENMLHGIIFASNFLNGFSIGLGYNIFVLLWPRFPGLLDMGILFEYKTDGEYQLRNYYQVAFEGIFTGGFSGIVNYRDSFSVGIAPEIGIQFPVLFPYVTGSLGLFYRYNFYNNTEQNCHELGIKILFYDVKLFKRLELFNNFSY